MTLFSCYNTQYVAMKRRRNVGMNVIIICLGGCLLLFVHFEVILNLSQFPDFLSTFLKYVKTIILSSLRQHNDMILTNNVMSPEVTHSRLNPADQTRGRAEG